MQPNATRTRRARTTRGVTAFSFRVGALAVLLADACDCSQRPGPVLPSCSAGIRCPGVDAATHASNNSSSGRTGGELYAMTSCRGRKQGGLA